MVVLVFKYLQFNVTWDLLQERWEQVILLQDTFPLFSHGVTVSRFIHDKERDVLIPLVSLWAAYIKILFSVESIVDMMSKRITVTQRKVRKSSDLFTGRLFKMWTSQMTSLNPTMRQSQNVGEVFKLISAVTKHSRQFPLQIKKLGQRSGLLLHSSLRLETSLGPFCVESGLPVSVWGPLWVLQLPAAVQQHAC